MIAFTLVQNYRYILYLLGSHMRTHCVCCIHIRTVVKEDVHSEGSVI